MWMRDGQEARSAAPRRLRECVERWPECESGAYDPRCCRFPKSCSCNVRLEEIAAKMSNADRVREALRRGEDDARLLDGRDFDARYWVRAKRSLSVLLRELDVARSERDAFRAVLDASE